MKHRKANRLNLLGFFGKTIELQEKAVDFLVCVIPWLGVMLWLVVMLMIIFGFVPLMIRAWLINRG